MTNEFLAWFAQHIGERPFFSEEEKEELKTYTWLAWRDSVGCTEMLEEPILRVMGGKPAIAAESLEAQ